MTTYIRIKVPLQPAERDALRELGRMERRRTEAQAAWLIRQELERRGLLQCVQEAGEPAGEARNE